MKIFSINNSTLNQNFRGKYAYIKSDDDVTKLSGWHKNSYAETTLGAFHDEPKNMVYFASPMEPIDDTIKENVDKVIYDNEPSYPDVNKEVSRNYFGNERKDYKKDFEEVREYYYRREMGGFANTDDAKYQQWQAAECSRLYDKGGHLRYVKEQAEDNIKQLENENIQIKEGIKAAQEELESQVGVSSKIETQLSNIDTLKKTYEKTIKTTEDISVDEQSLYSRAKARQIASSTHSEKLANNFIKYSKNDLQTYEEIIKQYENEYSISARKTVLKREYDILKKTAENYKLIQEGCINTISEIKNYIQSLQVKLASNNKKLAEKKSLIEDCKAKLIPIFDELKNFYAKQGIKVIKKV